MTSCFFRFTVSESLWYLLLDTDGSLELSNLRFKFLGLTDEETDPEISAARMTSLSACPPAKLAERATLNRGRGTGHALLSVGCFLGDMSSELLDCCC